MNSKFSFLSLLLLVLFSFQIAHANEPAEALARKAVSEDTVESSHAIEELRALGPAGLQILMAQYADEINRQVTSPAAASDQQWLRIATALDTVAQQKNSYLAGLYWHTDLESAKKASLETGKPILSLRLLGKLTDELSCANSRFFRTVLYSNAEVSAVLRERFVLHWESVRPVPTITIDFGDGRKLERTITGNSIHYILDSSGRPIEALPGLYGPPAFLRGIANAETLFKSLAGKTDQERLLLLANYYRQQNNKTQLAWLADTTKIAGKVPEGFFVTKSMNGEALSIAPLAITKAVTETTILRAMTAASEALGRITDEAAWKKIAQFHAADGVLDSRSIALIKRQNPQLSEKELSQLLQKFQESVALDTVRNEYMLHNKLYAWLSRDPVRTDLNKFNEKVYAELFLTPRSDPWLGLVSADVYTALDNGGIIKN
ncbi:MAG TPA: hypothetical protein VFH46_17565 [Pyrinomonadaceae bacterium]|nr:hypothetical protein [Pyrinomonadaceae bacterium]